MMCAMEEISDTLTLASEERDKQGIHELEISFGGELDLHKHFHLCEKNPGHPDFIPVNKLEERHLPKHRYSHKITEYVRQISDLTVKLSVNYVSRNRPSGYPLSDRAGQNVLSVGSGFVADISLTENNDKLPCPLKNCDHGPGYNVVCVYITIVTAAHVVFDDEEAKNTTVEFFYDDSSDRSDVMIVSGVRVAASSVEGDFCELLCVTHERELFYMLKYKMCEKRVGAEWRGPPSKKQLEILLSAEIDLLEHCEIHFEKSGPTNIIPVNKLEERPLLRHRHSHKDAAWIRQISNFTVKLSVNYVSTNRPHGYPLSDRAGQRFLSVGSGFVTNISLTENNGKLPCPLKNCSHRPGHHEVYGYITLVTAAQDVFDDEEAKNTTVEFFYDDSCNRSGVMIASGVRVAASSVERDYCELLCVTHERDLFQTLKHYFFTTGMEPKKIALCQIFETLLPGLCGIKYGPGASLDFSAKIRLTSPRWAVKALIVLNAFKKDDINRLFMYWDPSNTSLCDVLRNISFSKEDVLDLMNFVQYIVSKIEGDKPAPSYVSDVRDRYCDIFGNNTENPQDWQEAILSLISELDKYYSTSDSLKTARAGKSTFNLTYNHNNTQTLRDWPLYCRFGNNHLIIDIGQNMVTIHGTHSNNSKCEPDDSESNPDDMFLVHIAHPHGQSKHVTIGRQTDCFTGDGFYHQLYTAPTCPGCSGGPVWMFPASGDLSEVYGVPHSGCHGNQLNKGCSWTVYPLKREITI